jgi:hypothetical protein
MTRANCTRLAWALVWIVVGAWALALFLIGRWATDPTRLQMP